MKISQKIKTFIRISFYCWLLTFIFYNILMSKSKVYFSPDDKPTIQLINNIKKAKTRIYAAIYLITDKKIAQALINAKQIQGVDVQIITDQFSLETPYEKINLLNFRIRNWNNSRSIHVRLYQPHHHQRGQQGWFGDDHLRGRLTHPVRSPGFLSGCRPPGRGDA